MLVALFLAVVMHHFYYQYRRAEYEREIVADIALKDADAIIGAEAECWLERLDAVFGITPPVKELSLHGKRISDSDLARLQYLSQLQSIGLDACAITDEGVKELVNVKSLKSLAFFACGKVTDDGVAYVGGARELTSLQIGADDGQLTGRTLHCLLKLPHLEIVDLNSCRALADVAVQPLASLKHLLNLDIRGTSISKEGVREIRDALPSTVVLADYP